jgi:hypothetical protein
MKIGLAGTVALVLMLFAAVTGDQIDKPKPCDMTQDELRQLDLIGTTKWQRHQESITEVPSTIRDPGTDELEVWFKNQSHVPALRRISFRQLCFSFARDGAGAQDAAARGFLKVSGEPIDSDAGLANLADHLVLQSYFGDRTPEQIAEVFGPMFARPLFRLKPGSWQGPIESELGWHLVWIDSITSARVTTFAEAQSRSERIAGHRAESRRRAFEAIRARYEIVLPLALAGETR